MDEKFYLNDKVYITEIASIDFDAPIDSLNPAKNAQVDEKKMSADDKAFVEKILNLCRERQKKGSTNYKKYGLFIDNAYIGYIGLANYLTETPEIQIELGKDFRGQGLGYKATKYVIEQAFKRENVKYLVYKVLVDNTVSLSLIRKLGGIEIPEQNPTIKEFIKTFHIFR